MPHQHLIVSQSDFLILFVDKFIYWKINSADLDQLANEANWSGSTLFAKAGHIRFSRARVDLNKIYFIVYIIKHPTTTTETTYVTEIYQKQNLTVQLHLHPPRHPPLHPHRPAPPPPPPQKVYRLRLCMHNNSGIRQPSLLRSSK